MAGMSSKRTVPDLSLEKGIRSILVVRFKALGDIALSIPITRSLRRSLPEARIYYLSRPQYAPVLEGEWSVDRIIPLPSGIAGQIGLMRSLRRMKIDVALDLLSSPRSAYLTRSTGARIRIGFDVGRQGWCYTNLLPRGSYQQGRRVKMYTFDSNLEIARTLGLDTTGIFDHGSPPLREDERYAIGLPAAELHREWAGRYVAGLERRGGPLIGLVPAATYQAKSWPLERFVSLAERMIMELHATPLILWGPGEEGMARRLSRMVPGAALAPETGIGQLAALVSRLDLLVTTDSGPKHLAVMLGVPTLTLFGPTDPEIWDPMNARHRTVRAEKPCFPCKRRSCEPNICLVDIDPDIVFEEVADMIGDASLRAGEREEGR